MRRLTFYIIAAALAFSASCSKQEAETAPAQKEKEYATILYATFDEAASKTHLEDIDGRKNVPCWDKGDKIWVSDGTSVGMAEVIELTSKTSAKLGLSTKFSGNTFYAVYPYRLSEGYTEESPESAEKYPYSVNPNGTINIDIPTAQDGTFAKANISAAVCGAGETLKFRNVTSLFKITSKLPSVTTITCSHATIAGNVTFTYGETSSAVTTGDAGEITVTPKGSAPYYIAVAPGITYSAGDVFATYSTATATDKYSKKGKNSTSLERSKIYNLGFAGPEGGTPGEFTIDEDGHKVCFAKGNFYAYRTSATSQTWTYAMYDQQYSVNNDKAIGYQGGYTKNFSTSLEIDSFSWGSSKTTTNGYDINNEYNISPFKDWGTLIGDGKTWKTLSKDEWNYIVSSRTTNEYRFAAAKITYDANTNIKGMLLFPDNWSNDEGIIKYANVGTCDSNPITLSQWEKLENQGVVFLPYGFVASPGSNCWYNYESRYWANNKDAAGNVYRISLTGITDNGDAVSDGGSFVYMIRLVSDIK